MPPAVSRGLAARFPSPVVLEHDGGHVVATSPEVRQGVRAFLESRAPGA